MRTNEAGIAVIGGQESLVHLHNFHLTAAATAQPPPPLAPRNNAALSATATIASVPAMRVARGRSWGMLLVHTRHKHGAQALLAESIAQPSLTGVLGTVRARRAPSCNTCQGRRATRDLTEGDIFQYRRQTGPQAQLGHQTHVLLGDPLNENLCS